MLDRSTRETTLLLSANACLEMQWYRTLIPCMALQISRNYRLLQIHTTLPELMADYQRLATMWLQRYQQGHNNRVNEAVL